MKPTLPTPELLTPVLQDVFQNLVAELPPELATRLRANRKTVRHGTRNTVLLSGIWDRHLKSCVVDHRYFKYEHVFDPEHHYSEGFDWYLQFYFNPNRIYQNPTEVVARLKSELRSLRIPGFEWYERPNWIGIIHRFNQPFAATQLTRYLVPRYLQLIEVVHPKLVPILDTFRVDASPEDRATAISSRTPARVRNARTGPGLSELSRSISASLRKQVLASYGDRCARCRIIPSLGEDPLEIDHARPVCRGGLTRLDNLQPLCLACHQWKGVRTLRIPAPSSSPSSPRRLVS